MVSFNWNNGGSMTPKKMLKIISELGTSVEDNGHVVAFQFQGVPITLVFDTNADRMRLISPILKEADLEPEQLQAAMEANFHTALDARYCIANGVVWSAFIHPLSPLTDDLMRSAIRQVAVANLSFGADYNSGELVFQG